MDQLIASEDGDLQQLRVALTVNNVNDVDEDDFTALHFAAFSGRVDCVKLCIKMGANVNARTGWGLTPLHCASLDGRTNIVRLLLEWVRVDAAGEDGRTPLYRAIRHKHSDVARQLMDGGAKVSNVELDKYVPAIPDWVTTFIESRSKCRFVSIIIIGIHKYHRTNVTGNNDINVLRLISKHIWSTRMDDVWVTPIVVETKS
jgi:ankyrin repeat protein